jgi:hypothetical protein
MNHAIDITDHPKWEPCPDDPGMYRPIGSVARVSTRAVIYEDAAIHGGTIHGGTIHYGVIQGGTIRGGTIDGGIIYAGAIDGGIIHGGTIHGGSICGGTIYDGTIRGGTIRGGTIWGGTIWGGTIRGGTIRGGAIYGGTVPYSWAARWEASISSPGHVSIGCQTHSIADWLRDDAGSPVPWDKHCTEAERTIIVGIIRMLQMQMDAGACDWRSEP